MTNSRSLQLIVVLVILAAAWPARAGQLVTASLKNGDYGTGTLVAPTNGVVNTPDGVRFVATEPSGRSNALVNWQIGNNPQFRRTGTITFLFKATRSQFAGGEIFGDNYGFNQFNGGQGAFGGFASHAANGPGPEDDRVLVQWKSWHAGVWYIHSSASIEYDRWYSLGFAWGGPSEFELWVNQVRQSAVNIAGSFPWGMENPPSGFNMGLGDNHERPFSSHNSAAGVMFADIRMWNEYRALGDTVDPNRAPITADDDYTIDEDDSLTVAAPGVLGNDSDPDGTSLGVSLIADVANGTLTLLSDGSFSYHPNNSFHGSDSFTYSASDGEKDSEATVTITVTSVNDAPTANVDTASTSEDAPVVVDVAGNDSDPDGDTITVTQASASIGAVALEGNNVRYTPPPDFSGLVTIGYTISDGQGATAQGTASIDVTPVNDPPATSDVSVDTAAETPVTVTLTGADIDSAALTFEPGAAIGGTVAGASPVFTFTPAAGFSGAGGFSFVVRDDHGATASGTVLVNVAAPPPPPPPPANRAPVAVDDQAAATSGQPVVIAVLANDSDPDGDPLILESVTGAALGVVTITGGEARYQADVIGSLTQAITGLDGLSHGHRTSLLARLRNAQRALDQGHTAIALREFAQVADALERFSSHPNAARIAAMLRQLAGGGLVDQFRYSISDGHGGTASADVRVTISVH